MNVYIEKIEGFSALVYTHKANGLNQWRVYTLAEVPDDRKAQALGKQEKISSKRNCTVKTVEISRPPWTIDVLTGNAKGK